MINGIHGYSPFVSLWDMLKAYAYAFQEFGSVLADMECSLLRAGDLNRPPGGWTPPPFDHALYDAEQLANMLGLRTIEPKVARIRDLLSRKTDLDTLAGAIGELRRGFTDELEGVLFLHFTPADVQLYMKPVQVFGEGVATRFGQGAQFDIEEAGKCLSVGRATACAFHLMRLLERGLQALAADLGYQGKSDKNWQAIIQELDKHIKGLPYSTPDEKARLDKRSAALAHLKNVKDAWRNSTIHPRAEYSQEMGMEIWQHTKAFMNTLAGFL